MAEIRIALAGNPNSGKTTLFNALTGSNQFVGNWPGVTVEKKEGRLRSDPSVIVADLPGVYSLSPYTPEELVARDYLMKAQPQVILNLVDATNLERNLYLTTQLLETGLPMVVALNMMDEVRKAGNRIDAQVLSKQLGCPVVPVSAMKEEGVAQAALLAVEAAKAGIAPPYHRFEGSIEHTLAHIEEAALHELPAREQRWYAVKLFERDTMTAEALGLGKEIQNHIEQDIAACERECGDDALAVLIGARYQWVQQLCDACYQRKPGVNLSVSDRIDSVLTGKWTALPVFALIMFAVYYLSVTTVGGLATAWTNDVLFGSVLPPLLTGFLERIGCADWLRGLLVDGVLGGVGSVLGFVPQMFVLFFLLAFLESCGYMSRIAFILDRLMRRFGLSGKSFIPLLVGTGCGVPGVMASRTIESEKDRRMTVITTTFIPCSAKLPLIGLIAGALFGGAWWVAPSAYFAGIAAVLLSGLILKKTALFREKEPPFVMELPPYHMPTLVNLLRSTWQRGWSFVKKAVTVVLLSSVLIWFTSNFGFIGGQLRMVDALSDSLLAVLGNLLAPLFAPLGFGNWKAAVATLLGLAAKENVVAAFGILYGGAQTGAALWDTVRAQYTQWAGYSFLIFNLLCIPCMAAVGAIIREMSSAKWTAIALGYQTLFAYAISLLVNGIGMWLFTGSFTAVTAIALFLLCVLLFLAFRPKPLR